MCIEILKDFQRERRENPIFIHPLFSLPLLIQSYDLSYDSKTNTGHNNMNTQKMKCKSMQYPCSKYYFREEFSVLMSVRQVFTLRCFCLPDCVHVILSTTYVICALILSESVRRSSPVFLSVFLQLKTLSNTVTDCPCFNTSCVF